MIDFSSTFKMALVSLKVNKMRSILTSLGIIIGVSAVIIMLAVGQGASVKIQAKQVTYGNQNWSTSIAGTTPEYMAIRDWKINLGRNLIEEDISNMSKVAIIGNTVANELFGDLDPIGRTVRIGGVPFKVIGLLESKGQNSMGHDQDDFVIIPITTGQKKVFGTNFPGTVSMSRK